MSINMDDNNRIYATEIKINFIHLGQGLTWWPLSVYKTFLKIQTRQNTLINNLLQLRKYVTRGLVHLYPA